MSRYLSSVAKAAAGGLVSLSAVIALPLGAQDLGTLWNTGAQRIQLAQASQDRVDQVVRETRSLEDQYNTVLKEIEGLKVYNTLLDRQVSNQNTEMQELTASIDQVTVIERQIMPLMIDMIDGLEQFVQLDVPFLMEERMERIEFLRTLMERSDVTVAEKFRRVMEAYQIEMDYGRTVLASKGTLEIENLGTREVDFLRIGRIGLYYQTSDASSTGVWDQEERRWMSLDSSEGRNQVRQGLRIARKQVAPDLLLLPVEAPEAVQ